MKNKKMYIISFELAFLIGCAAFFAFFLVQTPKKISQDDFIYKSPEIALNKPYINQTNLEPNFVPDSEPEPGEYFEEEAEPDYTIKMMMTGEFHGDEIDAKSGEKWLGLFVEKGKSYLAWTKIKVRRVRDFMDDEKSKEKNGKSVRVENKIKPIFLLKHAGMLGGGDTKTVFSAEKEMGDDYNPEESISSNKYKRDFKIGGKTYTLKIVNEDNAATEYDVSKAKLVLVSGDTEQILADLSKGRVEFLGLIWAGDLDNDGKLDLYMNLSRENQTGNTLFLSSQAEKGILIKAVAVFGTVGC